MNHAMDNVLSCHDLTVTYPSGAQPVRGVSFAVAPGTCFALVGGSGAGKSTIARALVGLHGVGTTVFGKLNLYGRDMIGATATEWARVRGRQVGFVAQNPWAACDPLRPVRDHVAEGWRCHGQDVTWSKIASRLTALGVTKAQTRMRQHPHSWSGGMLQRASIAAAGALSPPLVIADEPTSALDADRAQSVLTALRSLGAAVILISHDMDLVLRNADHMGVLHGGRLVEQGPPDRLSAAPAQAETRRLLAALAPLPARQKPMGAKPLLKLSDVSARYDRGQIVALEKASLSVRPGEIVGLQGPSGCGKSTLLRLAMGLESPSSGAIERADILSRPGAIIPVFQDPVGSLVPHWPIWRSVAEPLTAPGRPMASRSHRRTAVTEALAQVGLAEIDPNARPSELSVGQCQRIALARAVIARPAMIVADEPTSALDSTSTWRVSTLLRDAAENGTAVLIVSHDSAFLNRLADRVITMADGRTLGQTQTCTLSE